MLTILHELGSHLTQEAFLETPRNRDLFEGQTFDHLAHDHIFCAVDFVVTQCGSRLQHQVNCDFCVAALLRKLLISFLLEVFNFSFVSSKSVCLWTYFCHSSMSFLSGPLFVFFFRGSRLHFTRCSALAFLGLLPEYPPFDFSCTPCRSFFTLTFCGVLIFFSLCFCLVPTFLRRVLDVLSAHLRDLRPYCRSLSSLPFKISMIDLLLSASSPSTLSFFLKDFHVCLFL